MFLDDQIVEMVLGANPKTEKELVEIILTITKLCHARVSANLITSNRKDEDIIPAVRQVCNLWDSAAKTLKKKDMGILKIGGFRDYLLSIEDFARILKPLGL